jgi:chaperonin GroEL
VSKRPSDGQEILFAPVALVRLTSGFDQLASLMAVTLGPRQGRVLNARGRGSVEVLSDAGTIARRVVEIPDRGRNTGAMILRNLAWRMHEQYGDGAATAAVLARAMVREAHKRIEGGIDPVLIRSGLELAVPVAVSALTAQAEPAAGQAALAAVANAITGDPELGDVLGELADILGPGAALTIEEFPVPYLDREYVEGAFWRAHPAARAMIPEGQAEVVLERPMIAIADQDLTEVDDVRLALEFAAQPGDRRPLLIVPAKIGDRALSAVSLNHARGTVTALVALLGSIGTANADDRGDLAVLTDGTVLGNALGRPPRRLTRDDLGAARRAVLSRDSLTIVGGAGGTDAIAERRAVLQRRLSGLAPSEEEAKRLRSRIARLSGGIGILKLGARTKPDLAHRRELAEKAFRVLTGMLVDGVVPGGGVAYLGCVLAVRAARDACAVPGQVHGVEVLLAALEAPFKQIVRNHGLVHPPLALEEARRLGCGFGFDAMTGEYADVRERGILDSARVAQGALQAATSSAISVLTTGTVVLPRQSKRRHSVKP